MSPLLIKICKDFATIWTTIDPIANVAIFAGLTASLTRTERHRTALRASLYATIILVVAVVAGQIILDAIGIHMHSLKVAGGIILFLFALKMLFGGLDSKPGLPEAGRDLAVFPMAVPSLAGPGAIMLTAMTPALRLSNRCWSSAVPTTHPMRLTAAGVTVPAAAPWGPAAFVIVPTVDANWATAALYAARSAAFVTATNAWA